MTDARETLTVSILDKDYQISSPPSEAKTLRDAAADLDKRMRDIKQNGGIIGLERIAVMAALNTVHELQSERSKHSHYQDSVNQYVGRLKEKIDGALGEDAQMELPTD